MEKALARLDSHPQREAGRPAGELEFELIELLFFAYRDFVSEPDRILERYGFGRAHHRVLHFVNRKPGLTIAALLDILQITKQSLSRVLKDLIEGDFVEQRAGLEDRRQRLLFLTTKGQTLAQEMAARQSDRIRHALEVAGPSTREAAQLFLEALIDEDQHARVVEVIGLKIGRRR